MANFILVHGAWHGAWCWRRVSDALVRAGHRAHAVTLTGLGERAHLLSSSITLETHISDVINAIEAEEMGDVVLAVHSYAGMLGTAVADRLPGRLKHLVYVDAVVPRPGESWSSTHASTTREARLAAAQASAEFSFPPPDPAIFGLADADHEWVKRRQTPHPGHTYSAPLAFDVQRLAAVPRTFVNCTQPALATIDAIRPRVVDPKFWGGAWLAGGGARVVALETGHDPMISSPEALTNVLLGCAA
jgi:pimeloyl-ACP methyl ester carboxylesterase